MNHDALGWMAALATLACFASSEMLRLRILALVANVAFVAYATQAGLLPVLVLHLALLNQAPGNAYYALTLQAWEQGRFIRFNGLAQWIGWLWPYAVLAYGLLRLSRSERAPRIGA